MISSITKLFLIAACLATISHKSATTEAFLLGNFIGCNSFGCRLSALETDVAQLKQQVARLDPSGSLQGMNNFQWPNNMPQFNQGGINVPNMSNQPGKSQQGNGQQGNGQQGNGQQGNGQQGNGQQGNGQQGNGQQGNGQGGSSQKGDTQQGGGSNDASVRYALDYPVMNNPNLRRNSIYPGSLNIGQFL